MKKILVLSIFLFSTLLSFAQAEQKAIVNSLSEYAIEKSKDQFSFVLTKKTTQEHVVSTARFYTDYFTTTFDEANNTMKVTMNNQDWINRQIMRRLFSGLNIQEVMLEDKVFHVDDFFKEYVLSIDEQPIK